MAAKSPGCPSAPWTKSTGIFVRIVGLEEVHAGADLPDELDRLPQAAARVLVREARVVDARHRADEAEVGLGALGEAFAVGGREGEGDALPAGVADLDVEAVERRRAEHPHRLAGVQQRRGVHPRLVGEVAVDVHERGEPIGPGGHDEVVPPRPGHDEVVDQPLVAGVARVDENQDRQVARVLGAHRAPQHGVLARLLQVAPQPVEHASRQQQETSQHGHQRRRRDRPMPAIPGGAVTFLVPPPDSRGPASPA